MMWKSIFFASFLVPFTALAHAQDSDGASTDGLLDPITGEVALDAKKPSVSISWNGSFDGLPDSTFFQSGVWSLKLSVPLDREDGFVSVDGFAEAISLEGSFTRRLTERRYREPDDDAESALEQRAERRCRDGKDRNEQPLPADQIRTAEQCQWSELDTPALRERYWTPTERRDYEELTGGVETDSIFFYGAGAKIGAEENEFLTLNALQSDDRIDLPWRVQTYLGVVSARNAYEVGQDQEPLGSMAFLVGMALQSSFEDQDSQTVCNQPTPTPTSECRSGPLGPPTRIESPIVFTEYRRTFQFRDGWYAFSVQAEHDLERDISEVTVPLYLWRSSASSPLNAGVQVRWTSKDDEIVPGVFLSTTPFRLFAGPS